MVGHSVFKKCILCVRKDWSHILVHNNIVGCYKIILYGLDLCGGNMTNGIRNHNKSSVYFTVRQTLHFINTIYTVPLCGFKRIQYLIHAVSLTSLTLDFYFITTLTQSAHNLSNKTHSELLKIKSYTRKLFQLVTVLV